VSAPFLKMYSIQGWNIMVNIYAIDSLPFRLCL
jgi:hypothetical protein